MKDICPRCGKEFTLGYRVTKQGGTRVTTIASRNHHRGVTCHSCAECRVTELDAVDRQARQAGKVLVGRCWVEDPR